MPDEDPQQQDRPADWYPDPDVRGRLRYWDGTAWTEHTADGYDEPEPASSTVHDAYQRIARPQASFLDLNPQSLAAIGFAVLYALLGHYANLHLLGIFPIFAAYRAFTAKEQLAPVAVVAVLASLAIGYA